MKLSRVIQTSLLAATTAFAFAGGAVDKPVSGSNIITDIVPVLKHGTYVGIEGGASFFNDYSAGSLLSSVDNNFSTTSTNGSVYGGFVGIGNDFMRFEVGVRQYDNVSEYDISAEDITIDIDDHCCLNINGRNVKVTNTNTCALLTAANGGTINTINSNITTSATYPFIAAKIGTKISGIDAYIRPGLVFAGNQSTDNNITASITSGGETAQVSTSNSNSRDANPLFLALGMQFPMYENILIGAEYLTVDQTSSINLNLTYKIS